MVWKGANNTTRQTHIPVFVAIVGHCLCQSPTAMSISVSRESISKLMGELVEGFPVEGDGRASISDFGKLLFTEGQSNSSSSMGTTKIGQSNKMTVATSAGNSAMTQSQTGSKRVFTEIKGVPRQKQHDIMKIKDKAVPKRWTPEEDDKLRDAVGRHGERNWKSIAEEVPGRNHTQCLQRWTKVLAPGLVKGHWRPEEDDLLKELVAEGRKNWGQVATRIPGRTSKQCRERWYNHLDPSIIRGEYTPDEDRMILDAQSRLGNRWSAIAAMLPGRTEDAVKIRWKSLCRVRKGQGRRGQSEKGKMTSKGGMISGQMMQQGSSFDNGMVKSEEVAAFSVHSQQHTGPLVRLPNGHMVPATTPHHASIIGGIHGNGSMYHSDMSGGGYDPTMVHYRKPAMQSHVGNHVYERQHSIPPGHSHDYPVDHRSNMTNMPPNAIPLPSHTQDGYRQEYQSPSVAYPSAVSGSMYASGSSAPNGGMNNGQMYGNASMNNYRVGGGMYNDTQIPSHHPMSHSSHSQMMSYEYGMNSSSKSMDRENSSSHTMSSSSNSVSNPAATFAQRQHQPHQYADRPVPVPHHIPRHFPHHDHSSSMHRHENDQSDREKEPRQQLHVKQLSSIGGVQPKEEPRSGQMQATSHHPVTHNPAAMFARSQITKPSSNGNPVAAFLHMQQHQTPKDQSSASSKLAQAGPVKPFNPAAAFAQRFQAGQRPPIRSSNSGSTKSNDDTADDEDDGENGRRMKKVRPRLSIDAARASAARRLRSSGSSENLAGRGSLDVFLNEIGDVGRLSDLKMDGFQTLEELWRVSGDMDRLSL
ncbi:-diketo-5-methylthio-1-phosphopentane phosphatase [Plasmopara halstedii]|uniref:-diketo-5-methylthio-1-phosphopentane phosphatase n=1 Tax=Plasmopara halstedii TaxID=4781 RepID=A0A0P1AVH1_PLAHL|nr:-diketo-5-methylthio-1-phosphopentane phosphatase [Plasmopara halstedii]CEG45991.1 -diketo-5-methylthio-1-phosphopentane phosphatase [Plasmopara halstedii]|eukprot:XP_024582360.1 -diketo-5-methylthio-1-phosphopentane phosphatase [Plasmopara halstedii]